MTARGTAGMVLIVTALFGLVVRGHAGMGAILPESVGHVLWPGAEGYWTPSPDQVAAVEAGLEDYLRTHGGGPMEKWLGRPSPQESLRQYVGIVVGGRHLIGVNAFPRRGSHSQWRRHAVEGVDGGCQFWRVHYDPTLARFDHLECNG